MSLTVFLLFFFLDFISCSNLPAATEPHAETKRSPIGKISIIHFKKQNNKTTNQQPTLNKGCFIFSTNVGSSELPIFSEL